MISRRRFFSILTIFLAVVLLFLGLQVGRTVLNDIETNRHIRHTSLYEADARSMEGSFLEETEFKERVSDAERIVYVGEDTENTKEILSEWAYYSDRKIVHLPEVPEADELKNVSLILIEGGFIQENLDRLAVYAEKGVDILCMSLPEVSVTAADEELQKLLGISRVYREKVTLHGMHLFSGFFLGGERIYETEDPEDIRQDLDLDTPWYIVRRNTKTYLRGILSEEDQAAAQSLELENEDLPALIWRNHFRNGEVYVVAEDFFGNRSIALGILEAVMYEREDCYLYPVINAQEFSLVNAPIAADENMETMMEIYGRSLTRFESDILLPQLQSLFTKYGFKPTCFMSPKYDYDDPAETKDDFIRYYLRILHEMEGELGLSAGHKNDVSVKEMIDHDTAYYREEDSAYQIHSYYVDIHDVEAVSELLIDHESWDSIHTLVIPPAEDYPVFGYITEDMTVQQITADALHHSFIDDLELLGTETALGYENVSVDMSKVVWPESAEYEWQNASRTASENISTYNVPFGIFNKVTAAEGDARLREYLSLTCAAQRSGDTISVNIGGFTGEAWFILRTHNENILSLTGGTCKKIEKDAYLITADQENMEIRLYSALENELYRERKEK